MFLVLGSSGKVGRVVMSELAARGLPVRAVTRRPMDASALRACGIEHAAADLLDPISLRAALRGASAVMALIPVGGAAAPDALARMQTNLAEALLAERPGRVLALSDYGADLTVGGGVAQLFRAFEQSLAATGVPTTVLRSAEHMENWLRSAKHARATGELRTFHYPLTKPFPAVSCRDVGMVAAPLMLNLASGDHLVHVEGPRRYTAEDAAKVFSGLLNRPIRAQSLPRAQWRDELMRSGMGSGGAELVEQMYDAHNAGLIDAEPGAAAPVCGTTELHDALRQLENGEAAALGG